MEIKNIYQDLKSRLTFDNIKLWFKNTYQRLSKNKYVSFVTFMYVIAFLMFFFTLTRNNLTIPVSGDFTLQEIPFYFNGYDDWWTFFKTGQFVLWDESGMLGVNNIGANSFYYLFNPFFLILLLVPRSWLPQAQAFMMITKLVLAGLTMKILLQKFKLKEETTWLIATAYAFCGWNMYYLWFNHFLEIAVLLPLVILGIENVIKDQKPLLLILSIFVSGLTNYFFLISFCFCGVLYAIFRYFQNLKEYNQIAKERKQNKVFQLMDIRLEVIVQGVFAFSVGLMLCSIILFPCFSVALTNSRVTSQTYLSNLVDSFRAIFNNDTPFFESLKSFFDVLLKWPDSQSKKALLFPLVAFFTPNVTCFDSLIFAHQGYDNSYASCFIYTPLLLMFIPCIIQSLKKRTASTIVGMLGVLLLMFTPFAYYCFSGFTGVAYARWYIFITIISCLFIGVHYDKREEMKIWTLDLSLGIIIFIYGFLLYKSQHYININVNNLKEMDERTIYMYGEMVYILILYLYLRKNYKKEKMTYDLRYLVALEAIVMVNITLIAQGTIPYQNLYHGQDNISHEMAITQKLKKEDTSYYRLFSTTADRDGNNLAMMYGTNGLGAFHSIYNYELEDFLDWSQVQYGGRGGWSMGVHEKRINLDQFLGVKYYLLKSNDNNVPFGFTECEDYSDEKHKLYKNENFIELGYAFDSIISTPSYKDYYANGGQDSLMTYQGYLSSSHKETIFNEKAYLEGAIIFQEDYKNFIENKYDFSLIKDLSTITEGLYNTDYTLKNEDVHVYFADWRDGDPYFHNEYTDRGAFTFSKATNLTWFSYLDVNTRHLNIGSECGPISEGKRGNCYVTVQARMGENLKITLYGERTNNQGQVEEYEIVSDEHMKHYYDKTYDAKRQRGFYVNDQVTRIKVEVLETMNNNRYLLKPYITFQYEDTYLNQINKLKENPLYDIKHDVNNFSFKTDFENPKVVVLQVPYDQGWSLKKIENNKKTDIDIFKGQGGFISFVGEANECQYLLEYKTPYYEMGALVSSIGFTLLSAYYIGYFNYLISKKKYQELFKLR